MSGIAVRPAVALSHKVVFHEGDGVLQVAAHLAAGGAARCAATCRTPSPSWKTTLWERATAGRTAIPLIGSCCAVHAMKPRPTSDAFPPHAHDGGPGHSGPPTYSPFFLFGNR